MTVDRRPERGSVTAEFALSLPAVVLGLVLTLAVGRVATAQVQCADAARAGAREAARGEAVGTVLGEARRLAPPGASVSVTRSGRSVGVEVTAGVGLPLPGSARITVRGRAVGQVEQP
jgi:hypothetical protein